MRVPLSLVVHAFLMKHALTKYTNKRLKELRRLLRTAVSSEDQEVLHKVRMEIKKIKAILRLLDFAGKQCSYRRAYRPFRIIFRDCGAIRDLYVMRRLMAKVEGVQIPLPSGKAARLQEFRTRIPQYLKAVRKSGKKILRGTRHVSSATFKKYLRKKRKELKHRLYPKFRKTTLHLTRKLIKELWYLSTIARTKKSEMQFYDQSAAIIGDWHDNVILIQRINESGLQRQEQVVELERRAKEDLRQLRRMVKKRYQ